MVTGMTTHSTRILTIQHHHRPTCQPILSYVPTQSYITINNSRRIRRREAKSAISSGTVLIGLPYNIYNQSHTDFIFDKST